MNVSASSNQGRRLGRYELQRVLGKGAQATVWLARDPHLERQVAIKLVRPVAAGLDAWLQEARHVGRVTHPHIVTLYEADSIDGQPALVFEYVSGPTLAAYLREHGALQPAEAVALMLPVLDALAAAHGAGVVHRDLKPSNILLDAQGRPKVTDFGIAVREGAQAATSDVQGTPGYLSPEAASGRPPTAASDVFGAGLVLAELLFGQPLVAAADAYHAIYRVSHEDLVLPDDKAHPVDDNLRAVVLRALARDPAQRWAGAQAFAEALREWQRETDEDDGAGTGGGPATLGFLLRRMRHKSDFPAMSESVTRVQSLANSENESLNSLTSEILKDVALTNKLLRLVNSAQFAHAGGGSISTVSRAVSLIGFAGIRNIAMSLVLLEHMQNKAHANQLKTEFLRALLAGSLASDLCPVAREGEEVFIGALFQNLGRLLSEFYFPEEAGRVRAAMTAGKEEASAARAVLGMTYEDLGLGVARAWGLPDTMQRLMRKPEGRPPARVPPDTQERLRWLALASNDMADAYLASDEAELPQKLRRLAQRYAASLGLDSEHIVEMARAARQKLAETAKAMGVSVAPHSPAARLIRPEEPGSDQPSDTLTPHELVATATPQGAHGASSQAVGEPALAAQMLATGIQDITNAMVESNVPLNDILRMILETMYRALGFRRVLFCLRDAASQSLTGRFGLGDDAAELAKLFRVPLQEANNLFTLVCVKGVDTLIRDASADNVVTRLPAWYRQKVNAPAFLLLPMLVKGAPLGLIYADKADAADVALDEKELALLKTLRNQAVMAFRQSR